MNNKTYNIDVVKGEKNYWVLDFSVTRPVIKDFATEKEALIFAEGYKAGIEIDSYLKFSPEIKTGEQADDIKKYIKEKKKYYEKLWEEEE